MLQNAKNTNYQLFDECASNMRWQTANEAHSAELAIIISYPTSATLVLKTTNFQLVFNFEQMHTVTIFEEHGIMGHIP